MNNSNGPAFTDKLEHLTGTLDRTANMMSSADRMIDHYRDLAKEKEREIEKLKDELHKSFEERRYETDLFNRYRNSTRKSFHESPVISNDIRRKSSTPKLPGFSPKKRLKEKSSSSSNFEITDTSHHYHSTPINEDNREQINYHLKRIHQQIESDRERRSNQNKEMENLTSEMKSLKEVIKSPNLLRKSLSETDQMLNAYKRKFDKQQSTIQLLKEQLEKKEREKNELRCTSDEVNIQSNRLKLLEEKLSKEEIERMKIMKEYTNVQERLVEADRERSELLYALSDVKNEAKTILTAYEETSQSLPELRSLLELSAKQKSEFSYQITKLQGEIEEYRDETRKLKEKNSEYSSVINKTESEKQKLLDKFEDIQTKYFEVTTELKNNNEELIETKQSLNLVEKDKQELKDKALTTLKSYRSKCRKYEREIQDWNEKFKLKENELMDAISQTKELEIENVKQVKKFQELSKRMEELQGSISLYVDRCQQVCNEKNNLEVTLSQTNDIREDYHLLLNEQQKLKDDVLDEKERRLEFERLCREYYENNLSLKNEKSALQLSSEKEKNALLVERNNHLQLIGRLQEQCKVSAKDIQLLTENNENLSQQLKTSTDYSREVEEKHESVSRALDEQIMVNNNEVEKSKELIKKLKSVANDNKRIRKELDVEKQNFDEKVKLLESSVIIKNEENATLIEHARNAQLDTTTTKNCLKTIINIISEDANNLLNLLCHEEENFNPVKDFPSVFTDCQSEIDELREKLQSCFSITKLMKGRYNQQRLLIKKARERIRCQVQDIQNLTNSLNSESEKHQKKVSELESIHLNHKNLISDLECDKENLQIRVGDLTKDLEKCTKALHKSLEVVNERKTVLNEIDLLNKENRERQKIDESLFHATEQIEAITEQLSEAKMSFCELKQNGMDTCDYADRMISSFQSISPSKQRRLNFGSPLYI